MLGAFQYFRLNKFLVNGFLGKVQWLYQASRSNAIRKLSESSVNSPALHYVVESPKLKERVAFASERIVITGGATGLGRVMAIKLGKLNATVAIWDSNKKSLEETANLMKATGGRVFTYYCNLASREEIYRIAEHTKRDIGHVTMLINNEEVASGTLLLNTPDHLIQRTFDINVLSHFWTTKALLPNMIEANKGHIVTISSMAGHFGVEKLTDYCATKSATLGFMMALKTELEREEFLISFLIMIIIVASSHEAETFQGSKGIKFTTICPYFMSSSGIGNDAQLRLVSALNPDAVADRIVKAINDQELMVFIPGWFKFFSADTLDGVFGNQKNRDKGSISFFFDQRGIDEDRSVCKIVRIEQRKQAVGVAVS